MSLGTQHSELRFERFTPALGATVHGIDLSAPVASETRETLRQGLRKHGVLFFRDQKLEGEQFLKFTETFGDPLRHNHYATAAGAAAVGIIEAGRGASRANEAWHADVTWQPNPPAITCLHAIELPPLGGDTIWTSASGAYRALPPLLAAYIETLTAVNFIDANGYPRPPERDADDKFAQLRAKHPPIDVPLVKTHPETGEKYIFVSELHTLYIRGVSRTTSESLLRLLFGVLEDPELHARFTWEPGSVAIWDNRLTQHRAVHDYGADHRLMHRVTLA